MKSKSKNEANVSKTPDTENEESFLKKASSIIINALKRQQMSKALRIVDEIFLGQLKDSILDIFSEQKLSGMNDKKVAELEQRIVNSKEFQRNKDRVDATNRKDERTEWKIKDGSDYYQLMWYDGVRERNIGKQLSDIVSYIQKQSVETEKQLKELKKDLQKMKIDIEDEDIGKYGAILKQMVDEKKSAKEIQSKLDELKKKVDESRSVRMTVLESMGTPYDGMTDEDRIVEEYQCLFETQLFVDEMEYVLTEGWLKNLGAKMKDATKKGMLALTSKTVKPIIGLVGLGVSTLFGGVIPTILMKTMDFIEKNGRQISNAFERQYTRYKNSKGVIAKMNFQTDDGGNYSLRFYDKDKVWRLLNLDDQLHHPNVKQTQNILDSKFGKDFRDRLKQVWDPLFSKNKGGKIDFVELFKQAKTLRIKEDALNQFKDFQENYQEITDNCIESPAIDTRTQK